MKEIDQKSLENAYKLFENNDINTKENSSQIILSKNKKNLLENFLTPINNNYLLNIINKIGSNKILLSGKINKINKKFYLSSNYILDVLV